MLSIKQIRELPHLMGILIGVAVATCLLGGGVKTANGDSLVGTPARGGVGQTNDRGQDSVDGKMSGGHGGPEPATRQSAGSKGSFAHPVPWHSSGQSRGEDLVISLVSVGQGSSFFMLYGHSGLLVEDRALKVARLYNYGVFTMEDENMLQYLGGRLFFEVRDFNAKSTLQRYARSNRDLRVAELNLTPEAKLELAGILADDVKPENRKYLYDHYTSNCATRIRDAVDKVLGGQLRDSTATIPGRMTGREHVRRHSTTDLFGELFAVYSNGMANDRPITVWEEMFLPVELERVFQEFAYVQDSQVGQQEPVPLLGETRSLSKSSKWAPLPEAPRSLAPIALVVGLVVGGLIFLLGFVTNNNRKMVVEVNEGRARRRTTSITGVGTRGGRRLLGLLHAGVGMIGGLLGAILFFAACFTDHEFMYWNQNLLILNPVIACAVVPGLMVLFSRGGHGLKAWRWLRGIWLVQLVTFGVALLLYVFGRSAIAPALYQDVSLFLVLFGPIYPALYLTSRMRAVMQVEGCKS